MYIVVGVAKEIEITAGFWENNSNWLLLISVQYYLRRLKKLIG